MTSLALGLILVAAFLHATWNLCAKRSGGGLPFVYLVGLIINSLYIPVLLGYWRWKHPALSFLQIAWMLGSGGLRTGYAIFLQRSYRAGDFSLIYPLARGTGPLLATITAILLLGERPTPLAITGGLVIVASIFFLTDGARLFHQDRAHLRTAVRLGITSGIFIAAYTIWDSHGVAVLRIPPVLYDGGVAMTQLVLLTPFAIRRWPEVVRHWREHRRYAVGMAVLSPIAYILFLTALSFTPISYIAPAREVSIVIGAFLGAKYLKETESRRRLWSAVGMVVGIIALALG